MVNLESIRNRNIELMDLRHKVLTLEFNLYVEEISEGYYSIISLHDSSIIKNGTYKELVKIVKNLENEI